MGVPNEVFNVSYGCVPKKINSDWVFQMKFLKFAVGFLLMGLGLYHIFSNSYQYFSYMTLFQGIALPPPTSESPDSGDSLANKNQTTKTAAPKCDIFKGNWVPDLSPPSYTNQSCRLIGIYENCMKNGRTDTEYIYWRWNPLHCELPKFNPTRFLDMMRHKSWVFIGDSVTIDHVDSLLCALEQVEQVIVVYRHKEFKSTIWRFPSHNFTVAFILSQVLTYMSEEKIGVSEAILHIHLDKPNPEWTEQFDKYDYVVAAPGYWFFNRAIYYENNKIIGCHVCPNGTNMTEVVVQFAFRKALSSMFDFFTSSSHKPYIFYRTILPDHVENGGWEKGICNRTVPFKELSEINLTALLTSIRNIELEEFEKSEKKGFEKGLTMKLLDTTNVFLLRPDGHPGVHKPLDSAEATSDCLHWCLPGPIDTWNSLMMEKLING